MEEIFANVNWIAVAVGAVVAYGLGALWFSPKMFGTKWAQGVGLSSGSHSPTAHAMIAQAVGTFLLAWVIGITETTGSILFAVLIAVTIAVIVKANGLWAGKSKYAIVVESGFVIAMVVVMIAAQAIF